MPHCAHAPIKGSDPRRRWQVDPGTGLPEASLFLATPVLSSRRAQGASYRHGRPNGSPTYVPRYARGQANVVVLVGATQPPATFYCALCPLPRRHRLGEDGTGQIPVPLRRGPLALHTGQISLRDDSDT